MDTNKCDKCKEIKCSSEFSKNIKRKSGLQASCKKCHLEYRIKNKEKIRARKKRYRELNKESIALDLKIRYQKDKERRRICYKERKALYKKNNKEKIAERKRKWRLSRPGLWASYCAKRRAKKLKATPKWLTKEQWNQIDAFYKEAARLFKETNIPHEVDHIIPLQGKNVSGLHVPWNLRVITEHENRSKSNKLINNQSLNSI
jgi:hypothetical protein